MARSHIIGIDLGGTNLKIGLCDPSCAIIKKHVLSTGSFDDKEALIGAITASVSVIMREAGLAKSAVSGVGIGLPGPVDFDNGVVHFFPNIPGWREVKLRDILRDRLRLKVRVDNDANLMALAESRLGAARGARNAVCVTLGTGVGGGLIIDGKLFRGSTYAAGEIGHIPINEKGPACGCGAFGCLETYIGNRRILAHARGVFGREVTLEEISRLASAGDRKAAGVWEYVGAKLGTGLAGVVNLLNPDCVVIGGGVANAGTVLFDSVRVTLLRRAMPMQAKHVKIRKAQLADPGIIGACLLIKE